MRKHLLILLLVGFNFLHGQEKPKQSTPEENPWYGYVNTGYAWGLKPGIVNPEPSFWFGSENGYDKRLTDASFFGLGFGRTVWSFCEFDVSYTVYQAFHYQLFQVDDTGKSPYNGSKRTRFFDLESQSCMFSGRLFLPREYRLCFSGVEFGLFGGMGIGVGINRMINFHTNGFNVDANLGTKTDIGRPRTTVSFAWQGEIGVTFQPTISRLRFDLGFRYFDGGTFKGPNQVTQNTPVGKGAYGKVVTPWKGDLKTYQLTLALRFSL